MSAFHELIAVANALTWPGAFAIVGVAVAAACALVGALWSVNR